MAKDKHPNQHKNYQIEVRVVEVIDEWRNKEDLHGGPGYYEGQIELVSNTKLVSPRELPAAIKKVARGEF